MLTDAGALLLSLVVIRLVRRPARGNLTFGLRRMEVLSAQANGATLLVLAGADRVRRGPAARPPPEPGGWTIVVVAARRRRRQPRSRRASSRRPNRSSLNIEGSFQHLLTDLYAFVATAIAGAVILATGFDRADAIAALLVAALMLRAAVGLLRASGRVLLEIAPEGVDVEEVGIAMARVSARDRGARPPRLGDRLGLPRALGARARRARRRLPRDPPRARGDARRAVRDRAHDAAGRPLHADRLLQIGSEPARVERSCRTRRSSPSARRRAASSRRAGGCASRPSGSRLRPCGSGPVLITT